METEYVKGVGERVALIVAGALMFGVASRLAQPAVAAPIVHHTRIEMTAPYLGETCYWKAEGCDEHVVAAFVKNEEAYVVVDTAP